MNIVKRQRPDLFLRHTDTIPEIFSKAAPCQPHRESRFCSCHISAQVAPHKANKSRSVLTSSNRRQSCCDERSGAEKDSFLDLIKRYQTKVVGFFFRWHSCDIGKKLMLKKDWE